MTRPVVSTAAVGGGGGSAERYQLLSVAMSCVSCHKCGGSVGPVDRVRCYGCCEGGEYHFRCEDIREIVLYKQFRCAKCFLRNPVKRRGYKVSPVGVETGWSRESTGVISWRRRWIAGVAVLNSDVW